jgi:hypothetical protein
MRAMADMGICPIYHHDKLPPHVPTQCLLLAKLNLKLITCLPVASSLSSSATPQCSLPSPMPAPTPGGRGAATDASPATGVLGSSSALSGSTAAIAPAVPPPGNFNSDDEYHWDGDDLWVEYPPPKVNMRIAPYSPLCSHISAISSILESTLLSCLQIHQPCLSSALQQLLNNLSFLPVVLPLHHRWLAVADTGATDHMVPDKSCFISYTSISGLSVRMGNNSYVPVLGDGTAIFALIGKRILVRNVLHVTGLAVLLYSLCTHITQQGCGFIGTRKSGFLVYFPAFILSVYTAIDCHPSFDPLGWSAPLATLQYVQPRCPPALYPSEVPPSTSTAAPSPVSPVMIKDNNVTTPPLAEHPILTSSAPSLAVSLHALLMQIKSLTDAVNCFTSSSSHTPQPHSSTTPLALGIDEVPHTDSDDSPVSRLLSTISSK